MNSIRLENSQTWRHHVKTYGENFDYYRLAETFNREAAQWQPGAWAKAFREDGARRIVLTTEHHEVFTLWPSRVVNPRRAGLNSQRDRVGELTQAVR